MREEEADTRSDVTARLRRVRSSEVSPASGAGAAARAHATSRAVTLKDETRRIIEQPCRGWASSKESSARSGPAQPWSPRWPDLSRFAPAAASDGPLTLAA